MSGNKPAIAATDVDSFTGSTYPDPFATTVAPRSKHKLSDHFGLSRYGVNLVHLPPGCLSSQRHWHSQQDEFIYVLEGEVVLVTDAGEQVLGPGMVAGFPAGVEDGHQLINKSDQPAAYLEVGDRTPGDDVDYPDIDLLLRRDADDNAVFIHKDGTPYD